MPAYYLLCNPQHPPRFSLRQAVSIQQQALQLPPRQLRQHGGEHLAQNLPLLDLDGEVILGGESVIAHRATPITFTAHITPGTATRPITYTWEATGLLPVTHTVYSISDTAVFTWNVVGPQMITVTAANECGDGVSMTHTITVTAEVPGWYIYLPLVLSSVEGLVARDLPGAGGYDVANDTIAIETALPQRRRIYLPPLVLRDFS